MSKELPFSFGERLPLAVRDHFFKFLERLRTGCIVGFQPAGFPESLLGFFNMVSKQQKIAEFVIEMGRGITPLDGRLNGLRIFPVRRTEMVLGYPFPKDRF